MASKTMWKGSINFGLVNIPVRIHQATEDREYSFSQLCPNGHRIQYKRWCPVEQKEIDYKEIKKGYELSKDKYIAIDKKEIDNIKIKTSKSIEIREFIEAKDLDSVLIEKSYFIAPDMKRGAVDKTYVLFAAVLNETNKIAIGKVVLKDKEHIIALRAYQKGIVMHLLHFLDEIRPMDEIDEINHVQKVKIDNKEELSLAKLLVENLSTKHFDLSKYSDSYSEELKHLLKPNQREKLTPNQLRLKRKHLKTW